MIGPGRRGSMPSILSVVDSNGVQKREPKNPSVPLLKISSEHEVWHASVVSELGKQKQGDHGHLQ